MLGLNVGRVSQQGSHHQGRNSRRSVPGGQTDTGTQAVDIVKQELAAQQSPQVKEDVNALGAEERRGLRAVLDDQPLESNTQAAAKRQRAPSHPHLSPEQGAQTLGQQRLVMGGQPPGKRQHDEQAACHATNSHNTQAAPQATGAQAVGQEELRRDTWPRAEGSL